MKYLSCKLLMIVTPNDYAISIYAIRSLFKILIYKNIYITIYSNGLSIKQEQNINKLIQNSKNISLLSNRNKIKKNLSNIKNQIGKKYLTDKGREELRVGLYESAPEIWERELLNFDTPLVGIIDPDFEIFDNRFIKIIIEEMSNDNKIGFYSSNYTDTRDFYNTHKTLDSFYSKQNTILMERYHTWFCIYRREFLDKFSDFSYYEKNKNGKHYTYDHSAKLQEKLKLDYHVKGASLNPKYFWSFKHYAGFSNNNSLNGISLYIYRVLIIGMHNGFKHQCDLKIINSMISKFSFFIYKVLNFKRFDIERSKFSWQ